MTDFRQARLSMIDSQLRPAGVTAAEFLRGVLAVPREAFVPQYRRPVAYVDDLQPLGGGRFLLSPAHFGRIVKLAEITDNDRVLDVGAASGYSSAVLAHMVRSVTGLEADPRLAAEAQNNLGALGITNAAIIADDSSAVSGEQFDAIVVEGALDRRPDELIAMLAPNGRLVAPILVSGVANVQVFRRKDGDVMFASEFDATIPRLRASAPEEEFVF